MTVVLLGNPRSGRGLARRLRARFASALRAASHAVRELDINLEQPNGIAPSDLRDAAALVVFGGDGTIHHTAAAAMKHGTPIYHVPAGTENLFARGYRMTRRPADLLRALDRRIVRRMDVGRWNGRAFLIMASTGPDAGIIGRLARARSWTVGHAAYAVPIAAEMLRPSISPVTVDLDGRRIVDGLTGTLIIANAREYAARLNFARRADAGDGLLDVVFLPHTTSAGAVAWAAAAWLGRVERHGAVVAVGRCVSIGAPDRAPWQLDGELAGPCGGRAEVAIDQAALPVLIPS